MLGRHMLECGQEPPFQAADLRPRTLQAAHVVVGCIPARGGAMGAAGRDGVFLSTDALRNPVQGFAVPLRVEQWCGERLQDDPVGIRCFGVAAAGAS